MDNYLLNLISHWHSLKKIEQHYSDERIKAEQSIQEYLQASHSQHIKTRRRPLKGLRKGFYARV